jgi:RNA polymerase sigma-70 factor (ECF subfamily)
VVFLSDDTAIIKSLGKSDIRAFDLLYEKYSARLFMFAYKYLRSESDAEELVQTVFLKIWENRQNINKDLCFKSYLFTIAYNDICKVFRQRRNLQKYIEYSQHESSFSCTTDEAIDFQTTLNRVQQIINKLPEKQKDIFRKSRNEGKTTKEIAAEVGLSPGTVDNYISDTLKILRQGLFNESLDIILFISLFLF